MPDVAEPPPPRRRGNGLLASHFVALADVDPRLGAHLLDLLRLAEVPAYLEPAAPDRARGRSPRDRLYVADSLREQALAVVAAAADEAGGRVVPAAASEDPLAGIDTDAEFAALVADWEGEPSKDPGPPPADVVPETPEEHYEPPPPPPLPRVSTATAGAVLLVALGIFIIARADGLGLDAGLGFPLGVVLVLVGFGILVSRMRDGSAHPRDDDDDGAVI
jgi:hypothetical protein